MGDKDRVVWSEGLFLRTHHFQQQDRHTEAMIKASLQASALQSAGFSELTLNSTALGAGQVGIETATGILPDGTPFRIPETMDPPPPVPVTADTKSGMVQLALPAESPGAAIIDPAHRDPGGARFRGQIIEARDTVRGGADAEEIEVARPVARLTLPEVETGGYTTLPIARIEGLRADGSVAVDDGFLAPALTTAAMPFYAQLLLEVVTGLDRIADAHGEMVMGAASRSVENLMILEMANGVRPRLVHMMEQNVYHPAELFMELAGLAGRMATFGSGSRRLQILPVYNHFDPQPAFGALADTLRSLILSLRHVEPKSRALRTAKHSTNIWQVRIDNPQMLASSRIVLRVRSDLSEEMMRNIFVNQTTVGSADQFEALWRARLPGIALKPLHTQPREIPFDGDSLCLELDQSSDHWSSLEQAPGFVVGVSGSLPSEPRVDCFAVNR